MTLFIVFLVAWFVALDELIYSHRPGFVILMVLVTWAKWLWVQYQLENLFLSVVGY